LLEIPRLGNQALDVPLMCLRILAAGSLGRQAVAERPTRGEMFPTNLTMNGAQIAVGSGRAEKKSLCSTNFTSTLLTRLTSSGVPLTHLVLPNCAEIEVLTRLPRTLLHLDLRGANLQLPAAAAPGWRPLSGCSQLQTLCLANNNLLCAEALLACVASLSIETLRALDLSGTKADSNICKHLLSFQKLITHLRIAQCTSLEVIGYMQLDSWLVGFPNLEVLDIAGCYIDESIRGANPGLTCDAPALRFLAVGLSVLAGGALEGGALEAIRYAFATCAPNAYVIGGSLDIFNGYKDLPPTLK